MEKALFLMAVTFLSFEQWLDHYIWHPLVDNLRLATCNVEPI
jgi:hypothetical protein